MAMMDHGIYIMMPVKCIGKMCQNCPNLKVDSKVSEYYGNTETETNVMIGSEVNLYCRSINRCLRIYNMMEDNQNGKES